jgi:hypothetical protein
VCVFSPQVCAHASKFHCASEAAPKAGLHTSDFVVLYYANFVAGPHAQVSQRVKNNAAMAGLAPASVLSARVCFLDVHTCGSDSVSIIKESASHLV